MARTAPVPNIPAIPGMCPGIAVLAGGAGSGGSGGKGAGSGGGKNGAVGKGGAGGTSADARGAPDLEKHPECGFASHPVDVVTGRAFTVPTADVELPGPLPLLFERVYSSAMAKGQRQLGFGWAHSFGWAIEVRRQRVTVWNDRGVAVDFPVLERGQQAIGPWGWVLRRERWGYAVDSDDGCWRIFSGHDAAEKNYWLTAIEDRNRNKITLERDEQGLLLAAEDSVGRQLRFQNSRAGLITAIQVRNAEQRGQWLTLVRYSYDARGDLLAVTDADGHSSKYAYDDEHRMQRETDRVGLSFHFRYDNEGRCVESWGAYDNRPDPSLPPTGLPALLHDGITPSKGIHHCVLRFEDDGYSEVVDSTEVKRYFGNGFGTLDKRIESGALISAGYDDQGHIISRTDAQGGTTTYLRDTRGRLLELTDALGRTTVMDRDTLGLVIRFVTPAGGERLLERDMRGNVIRQVDELGGAVGATYDSRGLMTELLTSEGATTRYAYDAHANLVEMVNSSGSTWRFSYDGLGRLLSVTDPVGATASYTYSSRGDLIAYRDASNATFRYQYDGEERLLKRTSDTGRSVRMVWGGYHKLCAVEDANGRWVRFSYNVEGQLIETYNARNEATRYDYTATGTTYEQTTFDGVTTNYSYDVDGRLTQLRDASGITEFVYNLGGELIERQGPSGVSTTYTRDPLGNIVQAIHGDSEVAFERDIAGRIVSETQTLDGNAHRVEHQWTLGGSRVGRKTSLGSAIQRSGKDSGLDIALDDDNTMRQVLDAVGRVSSQVLPGGARIDSTFDARGHLTARAVCAPGATRRPQADQPQWVGELSTDAIVEQRFSVSPDGDLLERLDSLLGAVSYDRDAAGQLRSRKQGNDPAEKYHFDETGNLHTDANSEFGPGNRLLRRGTTSYSYGALGELLEKRSVADAGNVDVWSYEWGDRQALNAVSGPGLRVEMAYDPFGRRVQKRVYDTTQGAPVLRSSTRFVWDGNVLAHEIRTSADGASADPVVEERTYVFEEATFVPLAQHVRSRRGEIEEDLGWDFYVNDENGTPQRLVDGRGNVTCQLEMDTWGRTSFAEGASSTTPLRFQGQYDDPEIGLHYNRFRYYDPEAGRYINHDPLGLDGAINLYEYVHDPTGWVDPLGLQQCTCTLVAKTPVGHKKKKTFTGDSGPATGHHKAVQKGISNSTIPNDQETPGHPKGVCAEPRAMTNYLKAWEQTHGKIDNNAKLQAAMNNIQSMDPTDNVTGRQKPLCNHCRALLKEMGGDELVAKVQQEEANLDLQAEQQAQEQERQQQQQERQQQQDRRGRWSTKHDKPPPTNDEGGGDD